MLKIRMEYIRMIVIEIIHCEKFKDILNEHGKRLIWKWYILIRVYRSQFPLSFGNGSNIEKTISAH